MLSSVLSLVAPVLDLRIGMSQFASMAAVSGSCPRFCFFRADTDSRRAADGLRVRLVTVLLGPGGTTERALERRGA